MRRWMKILSVFGLGLLALFMGNSSLFVQPLDAEPVLIAHRGVHQTFPHENLTNETCTAEIIHPPTHDYIENTLPSMKAAFEAGADWVEIDVQITADGRFAVFHDWTLDCRTNGTGRMRDATLAELKALDIGYGYTADAGASYPFRGRFVGAMPSLDEVFDAFPDQGFILNLKSRSGEEGQALAQFLKDRHERRALAVMGHPKAIDPLLAINENMRFLSKPDLKACLKGYVLIGWMGRVPEICDHQIIAVPHNYRRLMWGWPTRFERRMAQRNARVLLIGDYDGGRAQAPLSLDDMTAAWVDGFRGYFMTDRIEVDGAGLGEGIE